MRTTYQITEYGSFVAGKTVDGYVTLPAHTFEALENFILANSGSGDDAPDLMGLSVRKGVGKVISAKNYVGVITMNDGTTIEILPKINSKVSQNTAMVKRLLIDMLKTLRDSPYKSIQTTNVDVEKMTLFDPDNGLIVPSAVETAKENKYVKPEELADYYNQGSSIIYYQHKARRPDSFYIEQHKRLIQSGSFEDATGFSLKFRTTSQRYYFFIVQAHHRAIIEAAAHGMLSSAWRNHFCVL